MNKRKIFKSKIKREYGITLTDEDYAEYKKQIKKSTGSSIIGILIGVCILLFIVIGIVLEELPFNEMTLIPLGIVAVIIITSGNSLVKKIEGAEQEFIENMKTKYGLTTPSIPLSATPNQISRPNVTHTSPNQPKPAAICPICSQLIPVNSNPCPKCGAKLLWD